MRRGLPPLSLDELPRWKRDSDIILVILTIPVVVILITAFYCWIKLVSPGPTIFRQIRIGRNGRPFTIYKLRTMKPNAPTSIHEKHVEHLARTNLPMVKLDLSGDPRLIKGGFLMRISGLDELPQILNVLRGEMSLVGPRPCTPSEVPLYAPEHQSRFDLQPGLTGLWQVARTDQTTFREMAGMDLEYARRCSPWLDFTIILRTPIAVIGQIKSYAGAKIRRTLKQRVSLPDISESQ